MISLLQTHIARRPAIIFWAFLVAITAAELFTAIIDAPLGLVLHALLLVGLLALSATVPGEAARKLTLALTLAPLIRLLALALPLTRVPQMLWYGMVAVPLFAATWIIAREGKISPRSLGLRPGPVVIELMLMLFGIGLGTMEYLILQPGPVTPAPSALFFVLSALSLFVFTGFLEELIFRGLLQSLSIPVLGRSALIYVSLLFGALHIGHLSLVDVVFVSVIGLIFAYFVRWGKSILGVTLAHGLTNTTLFLILPTLEQRLPGSVAQLAPSVVMATVILMVGITWMLYWCHKIERQPAPASALPASELRATRRALGMSYTELAQRTGLPVRTLVEAEHNPERASQDVVSQLLLRLRAIQEEPMQTSA
jgi:membrane protease YdiL (CAAX protease family)